MVFCFLYVLPPFLLNLVILDGSMYKSFAKNDITSSFSSSGIALKAEYCNEGGSLCNLCIISLDFSYRMSAE